MQARRRLDAAREVDFDHGDFLGRDGDREVVGVSVRRAQTGVQAGPDRRGRDTAVVGLVRLDAERVAGVDVVVEAQVVVQAVEGRLRHPLVDLQHVGDRRVGQVDPTDALDVVTREAAREVALFVPAARVRRVVQEDVEVSARRDGYIICVRL